MFVCELEIELNCVTKDIYKSQMIKDNATHLEFVDWLPC